MSIQVMYNSSSIGSLFVFSNSITQNMINYKTGTTNEYSFNVEYKPLPYNSVSFILKDSSAGSNLSSSFATFYIYAMVLYVFL
jgi:hypothetical protein